MKLKSFADLGSHLKIEPPPRPKPLRESIGELLNQRHFPPSERRAFVGPHPHDGVVTHSLGATINGKTRASLVRQEPPKPKRYRRFSDV
jgi:hypothetical protein